MKRNNTTQKETKQQSILNLQSRWNKIHVANLYDALDRWIKNYLRDCAKACSKFV